MLKRANINWNARQLCKMVKNGSIKFDNAVQRGLVWDDRRKSLLIHSMLEGYPVPAFYAAKNGDYYDILDGKQRINTIVDFISGKFKLVDVPEVEIENENGTMDMIDINALHFDELEESLKDELITHSFTIYYFESITEEQIAEMFFRLNNGKALSAIELTRAKAKSVNDIREIGRHELFKSALTEKALSKYTNEDIVIKSYAMLHSEEPSLEIKYIRPLMEEMEVTEEEKRQLNEIYDRILAVHGMIEEKKIAKRILTRTHMISIIPIVWESIKSGISERQFMEWFVTFFSGGRAASVSTIYNSCARSGSARKEAVKKRLDEIKRHYRDFFGLHDKQNTHEEGARGNERV